MKTDLPRRVQRKRTKGFRLQDASSNPNGVVYVGPPTVYGNPWSVADYDEQAMILFRRWLQGKMTSSEFVRYAHLTPSLRHSRRRLLDGMAFLRGKDLACWCKEEDASCHADILLALANRSN